MAGIYFDLDQFKIHEDVHKILEREFRGMRIVKKKYFGTQKHIDDLIQPITPPFESIVYEKKDSEDNKNDFKIMAEVVKDLANPQMNWFIIATRDTDYITHAEEVHKAGKNFGVLCIENKDKKKIEPLSPKLEEVCDVIMTIRSGNISRKYKKGIQKGKLITVKDACVQTDPLEEHHYSWAETPNTNMILGWVNHRCSTYKKVALELDELLEDVKRKPPYVNYWQIQPDSNNYIVSPRNFSYSCGGALPSPFQKTHDRCMVFHLYRDGRIQKEVMGSTLCNLRKAIQTVYKILV